MITGGRLKNSNFYSYRHQRRAVYLFKCTCQPLIVLFPAEYPWSYICTLFAVVSIFPRKGNYKQLSVDYLDRNRLQKIMRGQDQSIISRGIKKSFYLQGFNKDYYYYSTRRYYHIDKVVFLFSFAIIALKFVCCFNKKLNTFKVTRFLYYNLSLNRIRFLYAKIIAARFIFVLWDL